MPRTPVAPLVSLHQEVEAFYTAVYAPGADRITDVTEISVTSDGTAESPKSYAKSSRFCLFSHMIWG
jgi:hypothetical protein